MNLYQGSYDVLYNRITDRGYAITSLTGTYVGMFTRDSAIQAMAHIAKGDSDAARSILRYLLSYHAVLDLKRGTHIIDELKDEEYNNHYLNRPEQNTLDDESIHAPTPYYIAQRNAEEIKDETLGVALSVNATLANAKEWNINGEKVTISVEKV